MKMKTILGLAIVGFLAMVALQPRFAAAQEGEYAALQKVLPNSKHTLADGIRQVTKTPEVAVSAKFELDDKGQLSLSVYTAEKGLVADAEHNVLKELSGSPEQEQWKPEVEVFKDVEHVARASEQLTLMSLSSLSLLDIIAKAEKQQKGKVFSIMPVVSQGKPQFVVLVATQNKVVELRYDLKSGAAIKVKGTRPSSRY